MIPPHLEPLLMLLTFIVMLVGLAGVVLPFLPDVWLIWLAALGYGLLAGFDGWLGITAMVIISLLAIGGVMAEIMLSQAGAAKGGASWQSILVSVVLGLVGLLFYPPLGPLAGAILGLVGMEYLRHGRNFDRAWRALGGYAAGCGLSIIIRLALAVLMIIVWGLWAVLGNN